MRSPWRVATAVRDPEGVIRVKSNPFIPISKRNKIAGLPVIRGAAGLFEAMKIGMDSLEWSAEIAGETEGEATFWDKVLNGLMMVVAFALAIGLFMAVPYLIAGIFEKSANQVIFHLIAGTLRILLLIGYMGAISFIPDITNVFRYHGAEHKSIFTFEKSIELIVPNAIRESRFHPRCGTSFLLLAAVLTMIGFMLLDTIWVHYIGDFSNVLHRILIHLPFIPLVAGASYEVLKVIEKHSESPLWRPFVLPGFMLQRITTREPDESQVEVGIAALKESLLNTEESYEGMMREIELPENKDSEQIFAVLKSA